MGQSGWGYLYGCPWSMRWAVSSKRMFINILNGSMRVGVIENCHEPHYFVARFGIIWLIIRCQMTNSEIHVWRNLRGNFRIKFGWSVWLGLPASIRIAQFVGNLGTKSAKVLWFAAHFKPCVIFFFGGGKCRTISLFNFTYNCSFWFAIQLIFPLPNHSI